MNQPVVGMNDLWALASDDAPQLQTQLWIREGRCVAAA
jgi:hypothetical protein